MLKVGLTGNIASGKTTVAKVWQKLGAKLIPADEIAHQLYRPKTKIWHKIVQNFGAEILNKDKTINRSKLAKIVFNDKKKLELLNRLTHPALFRQIKKEINKYKKGVVVVEAAVLFEAKATELVDKIVLVKVSQKNQLKRLLDKNLTKKQALQRINALTPQNKKIKYSDCVINGDKPLLQFKKEAKKVYQSILSL